MYARSLQALAGIFVAATITTLAACGGGGSGSPTPPVNGTTPTPPPSQNTSLSCAGSSAPTGTVANALYGCVRALGTSNPNEVPPQGIALPNGWADAAVATQDKGPVAQSMYVYIGGVYHDPLRAPTGSVSTTTNPDGSFSVPMANVTAALTQSASYYGYPGYALIEVSPVALASPCAAVPDAVANASKPNDYPTVACGGTQPNPLPSPGPNQDATYTNLFPYTSASSQEVVGFSVSQTTGTGWLTNMPIYITQLSADEATMFDGAQGIRNANECMWIGGTGAGQDTCGATIAWDGTPLIPDELSEEFARYETMLWQQVGQGNSVTDYVLNANPHIFASTMNGAAGGSATSFYAVTYVPTPNASSPALSVAQEAQCQQNVPSGERCAIEANTTFFTGFAEGYNGMKAPPQGPNVNTDYFQFYGWSPR